jgi:Tol biopolymer transport system component
VLFVRPTRALPLLAALTTVLAAAPSDAATPEPYQRPGVTTLVSRTAQGGLPARDAYYASPSADGRYVVFATSAPDVVTGLAPEHDVIVRHDTVTGTTVLVSEAAGGGAPDNASFQPAMSADGRTVAFLSFATDLVDPPDARQPLWAQVYVRDLDRGTTVRVTSGPDGTPANGGSLRPAVSPDGRHVAFFSHASDLVAADTNGVADVFLADLETGSLRRVSVTPDGAQLNGLSSSPAFSGNGRTLAFTSSATNLLPYPGQYPQGVPYVVPVVHVYAVDLDSGAVERISVATDGTPGDRNSFSPRLAVSHDGAVVAFQSEATNLVPEDTNGSANPLDGQDVFVRDRRTARTERVSVDASGAELGKSLGPSISADGRLVAFHSIKPGEDPGSFVAAFDVFVHDRVTGATELVSATASGQPGTGDSENASLSADGSVVTFQTTAADLVGGSGDERSIVVHRRRGPLTGPYAVAVADAEPQRTVEGFAGLGGTVVSAASPAAADAALRGAEVVYRPEQGDLLVRWRPAAMGTVRTPFAARAVAGGLSLAVEIDGTAYEVRAGRLGSLAPALTGAGGPLPAPLPRHLAGFTLHRCDPLCEPIAVLRGGYGTAGDEVRAAVPLALLGAGPDTRLSGMVAGPAGVDGLAGTTAAGIRLPDAVLPAAEVVLGWAPPGAAPSAYEVRATLDRGRFAGELSAPAGAVVWARVCLGSRCGAAPAG